jgi:glutathione S-transferase
MNFTLYDYLPSGNGYKVRLVAKYLNLDYRLVQMDIKVGATRTPEYLEKNPNGRIPLIELEDGRRLTESHAIISFLASGSSLIPADPWEKAQMWEWLCFEQYNLEPNLGTARFWLTSLHKTPEELGERLTEKLAKGHEALAVLERGLNGKTFLVAERFTLADIALYAYTHVAPQGGTSLGAYPNILAWIQRVAAQPHHSPITAP